MTISTTASMATFLGNGATTEFNFSFIADTAAEIFVLYTDADGVQTALSSSVYTLVLNAPATGSLHSVGGTVTYPTAGSPIASGTSLTIQRLLPLLQLTSISNQGNFYPEVVEDALDTLCLQTQQVSARTGQQRGTWLTGADYNVGDLVQDGANGTNTLNYYTCIVSNTSGTWATDLAAGYWSLTFNTAAVIGYKDDAEAAAASATASEVAAAASESSAAASAATATTQAGIATTQAAAAAVSAAQAADYAVSYSGTSVTSLAIGTGAKVFTTQASKLWVTGQFLQIASDADPSNYMHGSVTSYSGTTLTMDITDIGGSGTFADWSISISGTQGPTGPSGGGTVTSVAMTGDNVVYDTAVGGSPITSSGTLTPALKTQTANRIFAGPASAGPTAPTFRALVAADYPAGTVPLASLASQAANTIVAEVTGSAASPTAVAIAANKFPARASTGNIEGKDITDFALTLLDDSSATAACTTLGALRSSFTSSEQTVTVNSQTTVAHGLGAIPNRVDLFLICKTTDLGYAVGDMVPFNSFFSVAGPTYHGGMFSFNATNIYISTAATSLLLVPLAGGALSAITTGNWRWIVKAYT